MKTTTTSTKTQLFEENPWPEILDLAALNLPDLFVSRHLPTQERMLHLHFFSMQTDWLFCEYNPAIQNFYGMEVLWNDFKV